MKIHRFEVFSNAVSQLLKSVQYLKSRKMAEYGLKGTTCLCLCQIYSSEGGLSAGELSKRGEIDKAQVSRCVSELMEQGMIYREELDGRRYKQKYLLTEKGKEIAEDIVESVYRIHDVVRKDISDGDLEVFYRVLNTLCQNMNEALREEMK